MILASNQTGLRIPPNSGPSTLNDGLTHYYKMEEGSGTRADALGGTGWSVSAGAPGSATGKNNTGASVSVGNTIGVVGNAIFSTPFTFAFWLKPTSFTQNAGTATPIITAVGATGGFDLKQSDGATTVFATAYPQGTLTPVLSGDPLSVGGFHGVVIYGRSNFLGLRIDNGTATEVAVPGGGLVFDGSTMTLSFSVTQGVNGVFDEMAIWNRVLDNGEMALWYNNGVGRFLRF